MRVMSRQIAPMNEGDDSGGRVRQRFLALSLLVAFVPGCAGTSKADNERFQAMVARNASPGMPFVTAIENFVRAGFTCDDRSSAPAVNCERNRYSILPFTCVQRAELIANANRSTIVSATAKPIICASL